jgi:hypothetical protein
MSNREEEKIEGAIKLAERVQVVATSQHPYAEDGEEFEIHPKTADIFKRKGYIKISKNN